jgi:uncharacterized membrane protein YphA (DoxX/SURF4 family)
MQSAPFTFRRGFLLLCRIGLAAVFIYAGAAKLFGIGLHLPFSLQSIKLALFYFALQVDSYQLLPAWGVQFVAHTLPIAEILIGLLLLVGWGLRIWTTLVTLLIAGLFVTVVRAYSLGLQINCGCFSKPEPLTLVTVLRDGALLAIAVLMTVFAFQEARKPHPWAAAPATPATPGNA